MQNQNVQEVQINVLMGVFGLNTQQLAEELEVDRSYVARVISGKRKSVRVRKQLAKHLSQKVEDLVMTLPCSAEGELSEAA